MTRKTTRGAEATPTPYTFDWADLAFSSKKPLSRQHATFIAAPREISTARFKQIARQYLPQGNIILGLAKEPFVDGFEGQPQFRTLQVGSIQPIIDRTNTASPKHKICTLHYFQRELPYILEKVDFARLSLINGSWKHSFHTGAPYYIIANRHLSYEYISPFASEAEAIAYESARWPEIEASLQPTVLRPDTTDPAVSYTATEMLELASDIAKCSYDYSFQTGVALGRRIADEHGLAGERGEGSETPSRLASLRSDALEDAPDPSPRYHLLTRTFNRVVPYQTYAMHHGASREQHFSPPHDLNHYDTNHAEVELLINAQKSGLDLSGTTVFINLLPCPTCARMLSGTDITEFVYTQDHSDGYAAKLLEASGKTVHRLIP